MTAFALITLIVATIGLTISAIHLFRIFTGRLKGPEYMVASGSAVAVFGLYASFVLLLRLPDEELIELCKVFLPIGFVAGCWTALEYVHSLPMSFWEGNQSRTVQPPEQVDDNAENVGGQ